MIFGYSGRVTSDRSFFNPGRVRSTAAELGSGRVGSTPLELGSGRIGRDAFDADEWNEAYATALSEASTPTADYLIGTPHVADHLEAGLEALGYDSSDEEDELLRRGA